MFTIIRYYAPGSGKDDRTVKTVDTLEEAQEWCRHSDTYGVNWFDGYIEV